MVYDCGISAKFADIDKTIKDLDQKLKEGTVRQLGTNKVATLTEKLVSKIPPELKPPEKPVSIFYKLSNNSLNLITIKCFHYLRFADDIIKNVNFREFTLSNY